MGTHLNDQFSPHAEHGPETKMGVVEEMKQVSVVHQRRTMRKTLITLAITALGVLGATGTASATLHVVNNGECASPQGRAASGDTMSNPPGQTEGPGRLAAFDHTEHRDADGC
jgi:hypothetical protein